MPIWSKLGLIMIVPTIATIAVGVTGLVQNIGQANDADRARTLAGLSRQAAAAVHELQNERAAAVMLMGLSDADAHAGGQALGALGSPVGDADVGEATRHERGDGQP